MASSNAQTFELAHPFHRRLSAALIVPAQARLCQAGRHMLYEYCATHGVKHRRLGKIIVATSEEQVHFAATT